MSMIQEKAYTVEEFEAFVQASESDSIHEFVGGELVELPNNPYVSMIAYLIGIYLMQHDIGYLTGEGGGYMVGGERYAPDVAFISYEKQAELAKEGYNPNPPDLAVEVVSSNSHAENRRLTVKLGNYLAVGTVVWIVRPEDGIVEVHQTGKAVQVLHKGQIIKGGDVLPDFELKVDDILK